MKEIALTQDEERLVQMFNALGNPARFKMLAHLARCPECHVGDVVAQTPLSQSTVSQHLKVLRQAGVIHDERAGVAKCCTPNHEALVWLREQVAEMVRRTLQG